ncbi:MAG: outer membrane protein transport protein [Gammaproteobacteria bacterium]|nr:outer membrane protein transport protein [Gammaproteobacteria bacterium]
MSMKKILFLLSLCFAPMIANATNGYFAHGHGMKSRALAGAGVAFPQDAMAGATNPAGMAFVGNRFDIGAVFFKPDRDYSAGPSIANGSFGAFTIGPASENSGDENFIIPSFGINYMLDDRNAIGLSIYGNGGLNTTYGGGTASFDPTGMGGAGVTFPGTFGAGTAGVDLFQIFFNFSYAHKFSENLSVGISPIFAIQGFRSAGLNAFAPFTKTFAESGGTVMPDNLTRNGQEYSYGGGVQIGALARDVIGTMDLGISYRSKMYMDEFDDYADLFAEDGDFDIPSTLWAGFAVDLTEKLTLVADYQKIWYDDSEAVSNDIQNLFACPTAGLGGTDVESCLGGENGGGFGWDNIDIIKVGLQWETHPDVTMRFGYSHSDNPISSDQVLFNILAPGVIEDHVTIGATIETQMGEFNLEAMHALHNSVKGANPFDPTQEIRIKMNQFEIGASWSKEF